MTDRLLPPMCKDCRKKRDKRYCKAITDPWHFWLRNAGCFAFTDDQDWEKKVNRAVADYDARLRSKDA